MNNNPDFWKEQGEKLRAAAERVRQSTANMAKKLGEGKPTRVVVGMYSSRGVELVFGDGTMMTIIPRKPFIVGGV